MFMDWMSQYCWEIDICWSILYINSQSKSWQAFLNKYFHTDSKAYIERQKMQKKKKKTKTALKNKAGRLTQTGFKSYYNGIVINGMLLVKTKQTTITKK